MKTNKAEAARRKSLGELGELYAIKALVDNRYEKIVNLNDQKMHYPFADLYAEKGSLKRVISVKARNKYQKDNRLNSSYKLGKDARKHAASAEMEFDAEPYWMAVQFDQLTYSIYMGSLNELDGNRIPLRRCEEGSIGECLVKDQRHFFDFEYFGNVKEPASRPR